ncbi:MAG: hypothetical protein JW840_03600 [Candidatus Thermoplasmatota archaeon]|nr:hypothetical protein [Candidatus Thermoplasmatota archaeon]
MLRKGLAVGIVICLLLIVNGSTVLALPEEKITTMKKTDSPPSIKLFNQEGVMYTFLGPNTIYEFPHGNVLGPNLAPNPSFEDGDAMPVGWMYDTNTTGIYHWDPTYAHSGVKSIGILNLSNNSNSSYLSWSTIDFISVDCKNYSYLFSTWFKFIEVPPECHFVMVRINEYDANHQIIGTTGIGLGGITHTDWMDFGTLTHYDNTSYVKPEVGLLYSLSGEPNPLNEIRFDDVNFSIWTTAPNKPTITGETHGKVRTSYNYTITTTDPDQNNVQYFIQWGDNTTTMTDFFESGEEIIINHTWNVKGTYNIKVRAKDDHAKNSDWATLEVTMPLSYEPQFPFLTWLLERFPNAFPLLRYLLGM